MTAATAATQRRRGRGLLCGLTGTQLFEEFFAGAKADEFDLDVFAWFEAA